jgi:hypothetical protein
MCGFCRITDLDILLFIFSSKNYSSKVFTYLENVVVLVTQSRTKLSLLFLDFSTILYWIYKLQLKHSKGGRSILRVGPWKVLSVHSVVWTSLGPLPRWVPGPTTRWAPGTTRLALHGTWRRGAHGLHRSSTRLGSCTCFALYRGLLDVLD